MMSMRVFFFEQKPAYEMRISDWSSDVCSSGLFSHFLGGKGRCRRCPVLHHHVVHHVILAAECLSRVQPMTPRGNWQALCMGTPQGLEENGVSDLVGGMIRDKNVVGAGALDRKSKRLNSST